MPDPIPPQGPRSQWTPPDCADAKAQLVADYAENLRRTDDIFLWVDTLRADVCQAYQLTKDDPNTAASPQCLADLYALCQRLGLIEALYTQRLYLLELALIDAMAAIDCNSQNWRAAWLAAADLLEQYRALTRDFAAAYANGIREWLRIRSGSCSNVFLQLNQILPQPVPGAGPVINPWFDQTDDEGYYLTVGIIVQHVPPLPPLPPPPAAGAGGCGCGGATP